MSRKVSRKVLQEIQRAEQQSAGEEHGRRQPSASNRTVCILSYGVLALTLLSVGLIWRGEVKGQAARKQQVAEQAYAEQYRAWYERAAREWRWQTPQVAQRAPMSVAQQLPLGQFVKISRSEYRELVEHWGTPSLIMTATDGQVIGWDLFLGGFRGFRRAKESEVSWYYALGAIPYDSSQSITVKADKRDVPATID